jgi:3-hydroxyacyl-[acyl-carrier-protein] dehydratase
MPPEPHQALDQLDLTRVAADKEAIRAILPQRGVMEQIDVVTYMDPTRHVVVGYKDVRDDEFWVPGHIPGYALMPGVLMCEASAQLCSFYVLRQGLIIADFIGFSGMDNVRFRSPVRPGDRLVLVGKALKIHRRQMLFNVQGFVQDRMAFDGDFVGMPLPKPGSVST